MFSRYERFAFTISGVQRCIQKIEREEMERYGCKGVFAQYLAALYRCPDGLTCAQLSEICDRDKAAVSRTVAEMEEKLLVARDGDTAYRARIMLTDEGRKAACYVRKRAQAAVETGGKGLTDEERQIFYAALALIAGNLEVICRDGLPEDTE